MKKIRLFEMFSGIGSQYKALKNLEKKLNFKTISLGACDFYIDAIISYMIIHYGALEKEVKIPNEKQIEILSKNSYSSNSKSQVSRNYFSRISKEKLNTIFPYLNAFTNNDYFRNVYNFSNDSRERERERKIYLRFSNTDIKKFKKLPKNIDILTYSFPCQDLSQQGKQKGISKDTRSGLLYEIERILKNNKDRLPKVLLLENVKALTTKKFIKDFENWIKILNELGYVTKWKVLNSSDYNSFQNRERVFAISYLNKNSNFEFPNKIINNKDLSQLININNEGKELSNLLSYKKTEFYKTNKGIFKSKFINYSKFNSEAYLYLPKGLGPTLTASGANSRLKFYFESEQIIKTMDELEAYQYMGFNLDDAIAVKSTKLLSREKMIFTCGNSISVEVLEALFEEIIKKCL